MPTQVRAQAPGRYRFEGVDLVWESERPARGERKVREPRAAANAEGPALGETLDRQLLSPPDPEEPERPGVVIVGPDRRIRTLTPVAEELLGWRTEDAAGRLCTAVFDCRDERGQSLCARCGLRSALERHEIIPPVLMRVEDPDGGRRPMSTSFWYLPPAGNIFEPRVMAVLRAVTSGPAPAASTPMAS